MLARHDRRISNAVNFSSEMPRRRSATIFFFLIALVALLALAWWAYHPGLSGDFLFDDFANLPAIGATGPVDNWATFWRYITSGKADPTGRPLTLLTFLIDARNWPAAPYPFKVTNVVLHLINGALLAWMLWKLGRALLPSPSARGIGGEGTDLALHGMQDEPAPSSGAARHLLPTREGPKRNVLDERGAAIAALFGAGAWLLHPLFVSTTLYIVQREAMLPATFVLVGMLGWMASRETLARGRTKRALVGMVLSAWLCTVLAVLSKANGALFPVLLLLTEWIVLARRPMPTAAIERIRKRAVLVLLVLPSAAVILYLLSLLPFEITHTPVYRGWSAGERLLTEARVITDYLRLLFIPRSHSTGLFNDQFPVSTGWLHPPSTLPCIVLILGLIGIGFASRKRYPAIALALLFYFAAQLMESSWISLELYFEHRNYLPAMLLFWPIGLGLAQPGTLRWIRVLAAACILAVLANLVSQRATLWGHGFRQAQVWAAINPDSARAQANAALYDMQHDRPRLAAARLRLSLQRNPDDIQAPIILVGAECRLQDVQPQTLARAEFALSRTRVGAQAAFTWFNEALDLASRHACAGLDFSALQATLNAARRNPYWHGVPGRQQDLDHLQGQLYLAESKPNEALQAFDRALRALPNPDTALEQAAYLGSHGYPKSGLAHLDFFATLPPGPEPGFGMPRIHAWVLRKQRWWQTEFTYLRKTLQRDAQRKAAGGTPDA
jgi:tetratricopeptide (TPR) repeat protein